MKGQTATEYLIITAVVIILAVIVIGVLGGIPGIGGGVDEQANSITLSTLPVGITDVVVSEAKTSFVFTNNEQENIRITNVTVGGNTCWLIGSNSDVTNDAVLKPGQSKEIKCGSYGSDGGQDYVASIVVNYTNLKTNAQYSLNDDYQIAGRATALACPTGFIPVPGGFVLADGTTVDDFCVMKYEAKNVSNVATSQAVLTPWVSINYTDAIDECQSLGTGYDLITDQQWMVLAESILNTPINDLNETAEGTQLGTGGGTSYAAGTEPEILGCDLWKSLDNETNVYSSTCQLRGTGSDFGYDHDGSSSWNMNYDQTAASRSKLRTHVLSNGEVVWDLGGNVNDWVKGVYAETPSSGLYTGVEWMEPSQSLVAANGLGVKLNYGVTNTAAYRGSGGIFGVELIGTPGTSMASIGFRCAYNG